MSTRIPLARPRLPDDFVPIVRTSPTLGIFGVGADIFGAALRDALLALDKKPLFIQVSLRHAAGFSLDGERLAAHADALREALSSIEARPMIGVGEVFAHGVETDLAIAIGFEQTLRPPRIDLELREVRLGLVAPLARSLASRWYA